MMHTFLANNRDELAARCRAKVAQRPKRAATGGQLENGIPMFLDQLRRTLEAEEVGNSAKSLEISGGAVGDSSALSEVGMTAAAHGKQLLSLGYSIDQVVHDYGDACQSITDLAFERDAPFGVDEFRTLNRCIDNAIADAVAEFSYQRDSATARKHGDDANERIRFLAHDLASALGTARHATTALQAGNLPISGATGSILKRSQAMLATLVEAMLNEVGIGATADGGAAFSVASFIADAVQAAEVQAPPGQRSLCAPAVDGELAMKGDRRLLLEALADILQRAFKLTRPGTEVTLLAYGSGELVLIDIKDQGGGLPQGDPETMFKMMQGLSQARQSVEAAGGHVAVKDFPGVGCVFTIDLPRFDLQQAVAAA